MRPRRTRGGISVEMTANELLSLAVNVSMGWSLDDLGFDPTANSGALQAMLAKVYEQLLDANRKAVALGLKERVPRTDASAFKSSSEL